MQWIKRLEYQRERKIRRRRPRHEKKKNFYENGRYRKWREKASDGYITRALILIHSDNFHTLFDFFENKKHFLLLFIRRQQYAGADDCRRRQFRKGIVQIQRGRRMVPSSSRRRRQLPRRHPMHILRKSQHILRSPH